MKDQEFDIEELRYYMKLPVRAKLEYLEKMNRFLQKITPAKAVEIDKKLKAKGF